MAYKYPPISLLKRTRNNIEPDRDTLTAMAEKIVSVLDMWNVKARVVNARVTPISVCFDVMPEAGSSIKNIQKMKEDFEVRLACSIEIFTSNLEEHTITVVALPENRPLVGLRNIIDSDEFKNAESPLTVAAGLGYNGKVMLADIEELPHMLVAGTTGSGKTVFLDDLIVSILYKATPEQVKMILVDPKFVDLSFYNNIPHLLGNLVYDEKRLFGMFDWVETEMMRRYEKFSTCNVKNLSSYNEKNGKEYLPQILVIIDEYSEFMKDYRKEFEGIIDRIARLGRAAGIHLIIATQRPSSDVITSSIKSNIPCRASFTVVDSRESNAIVHKAGAQRLCGAGDMLFALNSTSGMEHAQAPFVSTEEIQSVVEYVIKNNG